MLLLSISRLRVLTVFILILITAEMSLGMTRAQLKKTMSVLKKQCMPKVGVSEDKVKDIEKGVFIEDPKVMCYIACIYQMIQVVKNDRLDRGLINKQVEILFPADMKDSVKAGVDKCYPIQEKYPDLCEAVYYAVKCLYEFDPPNFVFP